MSSHRYIVTSGLLKPRKQRLIDVTSFRLSKSFYWPSAPFKHTNNFGSGLLNLLGRRMYETQFPTHVSFIFPPFSVTHITWNFPSTLKTFLLFVTVAMLSLYQSAVNCSSRNLQGNFKYKMNWHWDLCSSGMLCSVDWQLHTDVSEQHVGLILDGQAVQEMSVPTNLRCVTSQKIKYLIYNALLACNRELP
jgi:hypothetical protein